MVHQASNKASRLHTNITIEPQHRHPEVFDLDGSLERLALAALYSYQLQS